MDQSNLQDVIDAGVALSGTRRADGYAKPFVLVPEGYKVQDLESTLAIPLRKRAEVKLIDSTSFIDYVNEQAAACKLYCDVDYETSKCVVVAVLNDHSESNPDWRDRIVHHLFHNRIAPRLEAAFIADSCACIEGRGTLYAARRLEAKIRRQTENWSRPSFYLKCDLANFFVSIDKRILREQLAGRIHEPWWRALADTILFHDPRQDFEYRGRPELIECVPPHKRLTGQPAHLGLPIGNLSSQFFANVYLDALDQFAKHRLGVRHYIRYVDDFVLLHDSPQWLNAAKSQIEAFLAAQLGMRLNPTKTILQPIERGVDFVGHVIKPWRRTTRRRTFNDALTRSSSIAAEDLFEVANSYFGLLGQASHSHHDRSRLANAMRSRGHCISGDLSKIYRRKNAP